MGYFPETFGSVVRAPRKGLLVRAVAVPRGGGFGGDPSTGSICTGQPISSNLLALGLSLLEGGMLVGGPGRDPEEKVGPDPCAGLLEAWRL